jgi:hypothetical protein
MGQLGSLNRLIKRANRKTGAAKEKTQQWRNQNDC